MIRSLCIAAEEEEELIEGFIPITRVEHSSSLNLAAEEQMCPVKLGYNASPSIGVCDLTYQYATLDRYPREVMLFVGICFLLLW